MYSQKRNCARASPNFHIHVSVSDLYIPRIDPNISWCRIGSSIVGIYKSLTGTWMWKLGTVAAQFLFWEYLCQIFGIVSLQCATPQPILSTVWTIRKNYFLFETKTHKRIRETFLQWLVTLVSILLVNSMVRTRHLVVPGPAPEGGWGGHSSPRPRPPDSPPARHTGGRRISLNRRSTGRSPQPRTNLVGEH